VPRPKRQSRLWTAGRLRRPVSPNGQEDTAHQSPARVIACLGGSSKELPILAHVAADLAQEGELRGRKPKPEMAIEAQLADFCVPSGDSPRRAHASDATVAPIWR
jgi:hypothetical protein